MKNQDDHLKCDYKELRSELLSGGITDITHSNSVKEVYIILSTDCAARCRMCPFWGVKGACHDKTYLAKYRPSLSLDDLKGFADDILKFSPRSFNFSGGDPLMYDLWYPFAKYLKRNGAKIMLTTNGMAIRGHLDKINDVVDQINISLEGGVDILDEICRGPEGLIGKAIDGLRRISEHRISYNSPIIRVLCTITDSNYENLEGLILMMEREEIDVSQYIFQHLIFLDEKTLDMQRTVLKNEFGIEKGIWEGFQYSPGRIDMKKFWIIISNLKDKYENVRFIPDFAESDLNRYYRGRRTNAHPNYCTSPWYNVTLMPNGDINICHDIVLGNIKENGFSDIWNGDLAIKVRQRISSQLLPACKNCFYFYSCKEKANW